MKINQLLINILSEVEYHNADKIVEKYLKNAKAETLIDIHDLLVQLVKSVEKQTFSNVLDLSVKVESSSHS